ncbi:hypothetical protein [Janthinobacterium sp. CAN_S7]|uniref:hypothetical protein n=1 Tax=Janthinobacterium sp. CAN_S7 TaxID=3071704 RepID=UPI00319E4084
MKMKNFVFVICATTTGVTNAQMPGSCLPFDPMDRNSTTIPPAPIFMPTKVWAAGTRTYVELAKAYVGELPMVMSQGEDNSVSAVNFKWDEKNSRFIVEHALNRVALVWGGKGVTCVVSHS